MMKNTVIPILSAKKNGGNANPYQFEPAVPTNPFASAARRQAALQFEIGSSPVGWTINKPHVMCSEDAAPEVVWKTIPCWHFVKRNGDCPHADSCAFVHDMDFHEVLERDREYEKKATGFEKVSHCWAYVQGECWRDKCSYLHPKDIRPYIPYTPCARWSTCEQTPYCRFQHPVWMYTRGIAREQGRVAQSIYFEALATIQGKPVEYCGTTYFPLIGASAAGNWRQSMGGGNSNRGDMNKGLLRTSLADSILSRNSTETSKGRFTVRVGDSKRSTITAHRVREMQW